MVRCGFGRRVRARDVLVGKVLGIGLVGLAQMLLALAAGGGAVYSGALLRTGGRPGLRDAWRAGDSQRLHRVEGSRR